MCECVIYVTPCVCSDGSKAAMSDFIEHNKYLRSNVPHLLALTIDPLLEQLAGGFHTLHTLVTLSYKTHSSHTPTHQESVCPSEEVVGVLSGCVELCRVFVFTGLLRLDPVETRLSLTSGGCLKQAVRLGEVHTHTLTLIPSHTHTPVMAAADIACHQNNLEYKV